MFHIALFAFFYSMTRKRKAEATNTAPSPKRTTRASSRADKATSSGGAQGDATTEFDEAQKHAEQVSFSSKLMNHLNLFSDFVV